MRHSTQTIGDYAVTRLSKLLTDVETETAEIVAKNDLPTTVIHFAAFRELVRALKDRVSALENHVNSLSYELLPTMFQNQNVKTIKIDDIGRVTVNTRWTASMLDGMKQRGLDWLCDTGNSGLIIQTVNAQTLGAFAKAETIAGRPLPDDIFKVGAAPYISITSGE